MWTNMVCLWENGRLHVIVAVGSGYSPYQGYIDSFCFGCHFNPQDVNPEDA